MTERHDSLGSFRAVVAENPAEQFQQRLQVLMAGASVAAVGGWGLSFVAIDRPDAAAFALLYCLGTLLLLGLLRMTGSYRVFRVTHPLLVLFGPYTLHLYLGGFAASGGAVLWSLVAPVAAMMFVSSRRSVLWVPVIAAMLALAWWWETSGRAGHPLTPAQASGYFAFNAFGVLGFVYFGTRYFTERIRLEQERADRLLLNVLPAAIAQRLKQGPRTIAERFGSVSVVFSDLVGFTQLSQKMDAQALVELLDALFTRFDRLADQLGLEKIKTIGDAYMVVAGVPEPCDDHAVRAARLALAMREEVERFAAERGVALKMRVGVHTGEVVAGVIGRRKFSYDLWGDTVNTASRMESHGEPGRVQVSEATRAALGDGFELTPREPLEVKGKGLMKTYWLEREAGQAGAGRPA